MAVHSIQIRFDSSEELRAEYEKNISNRGIFIETRSAFEVREKIDVEIVLNYVDASSPALSLRGEIVHQIPAAMAESGATPGIAVQFDDTARVLQDAFSSLIDEPPPAPDKDTAGEQRRKSKRGTVRVPIRVMPTKSPPFETTSRDLSATGILLTSNRRHPMPVGEIVRTCLWHPTDGSSVEIDGKVVREVKNRSGKVAAVAVAFDRGQLSSPEVSEIIEALRQEGHRSRLGGIGGSIDDLGLPSILQMFGTTAPQGTLVVESEGEQGWVAFAKGQLLRAELGGVSGHDALVVLLGWKTGSFQFEPTVEPKLLEQEAQAPLAAAVMKAMCVIDERAKPIVGEDVSETRSIVVDDTATFEIDADQERIARSSLDKMAEAVLELAGSGMSVERLKAIIPEPPEKVQATLEDLVELGVLMPR